MTTLWTGEVEKQAVIPKLSTKVIGSEVFNVLQTCTLLQASQTKGVFDILMGGAGTHPSLVFNNSKKIKQSYNQNVSIK